MFLFRGDDCIYSSPKKKNNQQQQQQSKEDLRVPTRKCWFSIYKYGANIMIPFVKILAKLFLLILIAFVRFLVVQKLSKNLQNVVNHVV